MTRGRNNSAERLTDVLALIRTRKQSGSLSIETFTDGHFQEGMIYFQEGNPTHAQTGRLVGEGALNTMMRWRQVNFVFLSNAPSPSRGSPSELPFTANNPATSINTTGPLPRITPKLPQLPPPSTPNTPSGPPYTERAPSPPSNRQTANDLEKLVPFKLINEQNVLKLPLSRPQRTIYMLVDGRRTVGDLTHFTGRSLNEVVRLLSELSGYGLISM